MRLVRIVLENWRGIEYREFEFADGVTLIEGPNEIGKSTLVEALLMLIRELDSSKKQAVKAIMPVGHDVGSRVEAEIRSGDYHFIYAKTYNKTTGTSLDILAPKKEQLTGREAHERVAQMLDETVDLALWNALLAEQGKSTAPADLKDSAGLAHALDEAAGSAASEQEDMDLYDAVQAEYEKYFTLKTGRPRFTPLEKDAEKAQADRDAAQQALDEVQRKVDEQERARDDVRRRRESLPGFESKASEHEASWRAVDKLKQQLALEETRLEAAKEQLAAAEKASAERQALVEAIATDEAALVARKKEQEPLQRRVDELRRKSESAALVAEDKRKRRNEARKLYATARDDLAHLDEVDRQVRAEKRLRDYKAVAARLQSASQTVHQLQIDDRALDELRALDRALELARQKRDLAATKVFVAAEAPLDFAIDREPVSLGSGDVTERTVAAGLDIHLPGVASVRVAPPHSAAELDAEFGEAERGYGEALGRYRVESLEEAIRQNEGRRAAEQDVRQLKTRAKEILEDETAEEIAELVRSLNGSIETYRAQRAPDQDLPPGPAEARERAASAERLLQEAEDGVEQARQKETEQRDELAGADASLRNAAQSVVGLEATLGEKQSRLATAREASRDEALAKAIEEKKENLRTLEQAVAEIREQLDALNPESVEALYTNAKDALERGRKDLQTAERNLAVLDDRLEQAQADGRFEALEAADRRYQELHAELQATQRRAAAAERLWITMNEHRDAARQAYVRPLKEAIERLGQIVFGPTFEIAIGDDWTLEARTLEDSTLSFEDLSIGAKEQLGILTRLAAAQIVAPQGGVPLIIDDALGFSDPSRLDTMGAAIAAAGRHCQVVILTCTPGRFSNVGSATTVQF